MTATDTKLIQRPVESTPALQVLGETIVCAVTGADTGGAYTVAIASSPPGGGPPGLHTHPAQETFLILEGEYEFSGHDGRQEYTLRAGPGTVVHVAAGQPHNYRHVGTGTGRYLAVFAPAGMEHFFADLATLATDSPGPPDLERAMAICHEHRVVFLPPPSHD
jgi:quercetin dioxygenase-like cupin family protein